MRHLHWLRGQIGDALLDAMVLTTGGEAYRRADGIAVVPLALFAPSQLRAGLLPRPLTGPKAVTLPVG